jgi:hypothetical protein
MTLPRLPPIPCFWCCSVAAACMGPMHKTKMTAGTMTAMAARCRCCCRCRRCRRSGEAGDGCRMSTRAEPRPVVLGEKFRWGVCMVSTPSSVVIVVVPAVIAAARNCVTSVERASGSPATALADASRAGQNRIREKYTRTQPSKAPQRGNQGMLLLCPFLACHALAPNKFDLRASALPGSRRSCERAAYRPQYDARARVFCGWRSVCVCVHVSSVSGTRALINH